MKVTTDACLFGAWAADRIKNNQSIKNILDIGSGTGLLSLMLAQKSSATIDGIEIQEKDYLQSLENIAASSWEDRIHIYHGDAEKFSFNKKYNSIISNPPFYENDLKSFRVAKNIAHHNLGLNLKTLIHIVLQHLHSDGKFFLLLSEKRKKELFKFLADEKLYCNHFVEVHQTEKHIHPFRIMAEISFEKTNMLSEKILIKENENYSAVFSSLLKDYYLTL
jgi:tRNA1Val (adenine37-N6)-methyltransferase